MIILVLHWSLPSIIVEGAQEALTDMPPRSEEVCKD